VVAWFIAKTPVLYVPVPGQSAVVFRNAEYRTENPAELQALRAAAAAGLCSEVQARIVPEALAKPYAVNLRSGEIHDLTMSLPMCQVPEALLQGQDVEGWKTYTLLAAARRWNADSDLCGHCFKSER
jgi:hypothetical protein